MLLGGNVALYCSEKQMLLENTALGVGRLGREFALGMQCYSGDAMCLGVEFALGSGSRSGESYTERVDKCNIHQPIFVR